MDVSEYNGDCIKRGYTDSFDSRKGDGDKSEDEDEGSDKKKHRSSKSRRHGNELEDLESGSRGRASDECGDGKRKSSIRTDSFDKDDPRKEIRSKMTIKDFGSNDQGNHSSDRDKRDKSEKKLTSGYLVDYPENHKDDGSDDGGRLEEDFSKSRGDNGSLNEGGRQAVVKGSSQDLSYTDGKSIQEQYTESRIDKKPQKGIKHEAEDSRYTGQKDTGNNQSQGTSFDKHIKEESYRSSRRKWDEPDFTEKVTHGTGDDYGDRIDSRGNRLQDKPGSTRERTTDARETSLSSCTSHFESNQNQADDQKSTRASNKEEKFADPERNKSRGRWDVREEDHDGYKLIPESHEYKYGNSRDDRHNRSREAIGSLENSENRSIQRMQSEMHAERKDSTPNRKDDKLVNLEEDGLSGRRLQDRRDDLDDSDRGRSASRSKSGRTFESSRRSKSPERRRYRQGSEEHERGNSDERAGSDNERSSSLKGRDREFKEERSKSRDQGYNSRVREWDGSADNWSRKHHKRYDRDMKDVEGERSHDKEWDTKRRDKERMDNENVPGRSSRSDRTRQDGIRAFSNYAVDENSESFAIRRTPAEFGKEPGPAYSGKRIESGRDFGSKMAEEDWGYSAGDKTRSVDLYTVGDEKQDKFTDEGPSVIDQSTGLSSGRADCDSHTGRGRVHKGPTNAIHVSTSDSVNGSQVPFVNSQGFPPNRMIQQGSKVGRPGRGGRARTTPSRDMQRVGIPGPIMGHPFGPMGMPPGPMQPMGPNVPPSPGPHMAPGMFMLPTGPLLWPGPRGVDMNMLAVPAGMPHIPPPGPAGPRFPPNIGAFPNHPTNFNHPGPVRGVFPNISAPGFSGVNGMAPPLGRGVNDKAASSWVPPRNSGSSGKAPSRGEQNDYSQNFVDTGMRPQNFIRELELTNVVEDYPKLRELIQKKDEIVANSNCPPMYHKCDLKEFVLNHEFFGSKFDVILVDPPWEEYVHRAPGIGDHMECWNFEEIQNLKIEAIADTPSFIFLWVGDGMGLEQGRLCLKKWGFRRCEDICWVKTNKGNATPGLRHDSHTLFQHSKEHCLMGIKGTVRRSTDGHIIHANIDTDIIIAEEPPYGSTAKPEDLYRIVEHFALGRRRIELFGEDHNIRPGWLTVGKGLTSSNFNRETYCKNFADKDGKVWLGGGGRNPPPDAPHLVLTTPDIESLRPKSPPAKNQQQGSSVSQPTANSSSKRPANSPAHPNQIVLTPSPSQSIGIMPEPPNLNFQGGVQWSPMGMKPPIDSNHPTMEDKSFDNYGCNVQTISENVEFESHRTLNML